MPLDEAISNGHISVADLLIEGIRQWEADETEDELETNDEECIDNDHVICSGVDLSSNAISKINSQLFPKIFFPRVNPITMLYNIMSINYLK